MSYIGLNVKLKFWVKCLVSIGTPLLSGSTGKYTLTSMCVRAIYMCVTVQIKAGMTFILACTVLQYTHDTFGCLITCLHKIVTLLYWTNDLCLWSERIDNKRKECWKKLNSNVKMLEIYHHHQCLHEIFVVVSYFCSCVKRWSCD